MALARNERILIVEDDETLCRLLERILSGAGYGEVKSIQDPRHALPSFREWQPALVILDVRMPHLDGIAVMQQIRARMSSDEFVPFVLITGDASMETKQSALAAGASEFLTKPFDVPEVLLRIGNLLELRRVQQELRSALAHSEAQREKAQLDLVERLALAARYSDPLSQADPAEVAQLAAHIARALGMPDHEVEAIRLAAPLHDLGMIGVPQELLHRRESLSLEELDDIRTHASIGARILGNSDMPLLQLAEEIALYHHESWDGTGYTPGLSGEAIPLAARIVAVADTFYAMTERRPYQDAKSTESAVAWIQGQSGARFDPQVVQAFLRVCATNDLPLLSRGTEADG